jgi:hypothetical protein
MFGYKSKAFRREHHILVCTQYKTLLLNTIS